MRKLVVAALAAGAIFQVGVLAQNALTAAEVSDGFKMMWDGKSIDNFNAGWVRYIKGNATNTDLPTDWKYDAATQSVVLNTNSADLRSTAQFGDFDFRLEYRSDGNSGIDYRCMLTQNSLWMTGIEYAVDEKSTSDSISPGAAYALYPPRPNTYKFKSTNEWNKARIVCIGDSVEHWMNGTKVVAFKLHSPDFWKRYAISKWGTGSNGLGTGNTYQLTNVDPSKKQNSDYIKSGYFGLQGDHKKTILQFRNFRVTDKPYFGPEHTSVLVLPGTRKNGLQELTRNSILRPGFGKLSFPLDRTDGRSVTLISSNGALRAGALTPEGNAEFSGSFQPGAYFLNLSTGSENLIQKLYIVP